MAAGLLRVYPTKRVETHGGRQRVDDTDRIDGGAATECARAYRCDHTKAAFGLHA
jgi:hypothetical protein